MPDADKITRILFIGNSYTYYNEMPALLTQLVAARGHGTLQTEVVAFGAATLKGHWTREQAATRIAEGNWDYVVLQEQSVRPIKNRAAMHQYVRQFDTLIREHGATTVLYLTWARADKPQTQEILTESYCSIGAELGALVVPVGPAWQRALAAAPALRLHDSDNSHPSLAGSQLTAEVFYSALFDTAPEQPA